MKTILSFLFLPIFIQSARRYSCSKLSAYRIPTSRYCIKNNNVLAYVPDMVQQNGYTLERYNITTSDNYILTVFKVLKQSTKQYSVFLQHGILANSATWVDINNRSLAFYLADKGYDVWMGNIRGTFYSRENTEITVNNPNYWNYTLDILAANDIKDQLNLAYTVGQKKLHYMSHSMGTTLILMFASSFPEIANEQLASLSLMAPVAYLDGNIYIELIKGIGFFLIDVLNVINIKGLLYQDYLIHIFTNYFCSFAPYLCTALRNILFGYSTNIKSQDLLVFYSYFIDGVSIYQLKQYLQITRSAKFEKFDFGRKGNERAYGISNPPLYDLENITLPVCLYYGQNDTLYTQRNMDRLYDQLGSTIKCNYSIPVNSTYYYSHVDFVYGENLIEALYDLMYEFLEATEA